MASNGLDYERMETEADRILYRRVRGVEDDVRDQQGDIKEIRRRMEAGLWLQVTILGGVLYSIISSVMGGG